MKDEENTQKKEGDDTDDTSDVEADERNDRVNSATVLTYNLISMRSPCL